VRLVTRTTHGVRLRTMACVAAATFAAGAHAAAQTGPQDVRVPVQDVLNPQPGAPQPLPATAIDLATAVRVALRQSPDLQFARLDLASATGRWQQARGTFDNRFNILSSFGYTTSPIRPALRGREADKRLQLFEIANGFTEANVEIRGYLEASEVEPSRCPPTLTSLTGEADPLNFTFFDQIRDPLESSITGVSEGLRNVIIPEFRDVARGFNFADLCSGELTSRRGSNRKLWQDASLFGPIGLDRVLTDFPQFPRELVGLGTELTEAIAARARLAYERLGGVPVAELRESLVFDASVSKPFRNGFIVGADVVLQSASHNFLDKPLDPSFGGFEQPNRFPASFALSLTAPIGRGRGRTAVAANELASVHLVASRRDDVLHSASEEVLRTTLAYLDVLAAQQRVTLYDQSLARQGQLVQLTAQQVEAGDMIAAENNRARARQAFIATSVSQARTDLLTARMRLADVLGLPITSIDQAPTATGELSETVPPVPDLSTAVNPQGPLELRYDRRALTRLRDASAVLEAAGRANLRGRFDFSVRGGMANTYESPLFFYLPDERQPIISPDPQTFPERGVSFGVPTGFYRSVTGRYEPFAFASMTIELPFGNNAARGRLLQAQANLQSADIQATRLDRVARENIVASENALRRAAESIELLKTSVSASEQTLSATMEQLRIGEATLFNTIRTEDEVLGDRLELIRMLQSYYQTLARLKFEAGTLVTVEGAGGAAEALVFNASEFSR
jgi:outer membrane protein TolC